MKKYLIIFLLLTNSVLSDNKIILDVPAYIWHHGCGPTSLAMIMGYYDAHGFPDLIPGSPYFQNSIVDSIIASPKHYLDYSLPLDDENNIKADKSELGGAHESDCIADFLKTSWSSEKAAYSYTYISNLIPGFKNYVESIYPDCIAQCTEILMYNYAWDVYKNEIDHNRPVLLFVDKDGDGLSDHFVVGVGYDEEGKYFAYNTYNRFREVYDWQGIGKNVDYGIHSFCILNLSSGNDITKNEYLDNNYPNPFNPVTTISFKITDASFTELRVYNLLGKEIDKLIKKFLNPGSYSIVWNGINYASGIYFYQLRTNKHVEAKKMMLLK